MQSKSQESQKASISASGGGHLGSAGVTMLRAYLIVGAYLFMLVIMLAMLLLGG